MQEKPKNRRFSAANWITSGLFLLFIFAFFAQNLLRAAPGAEALLAKPGAGFDRATLTALEDNYNEEFAQKLKFIDLHGALQRAMGKREVGNFDTIKGADGKLLPGYPGSNVMVPRDHFDAAGYDYLQTVSDYCAQQGGAFLYVKTPNWVIEGYTELPPGVEDHQNENDDELLALLSGMGVDVLDLRQSLAEDGIDPASVFFTTDHHWTIETAFWAHGVILTRLQQTGLEFPNLERNTSLENYDIEVYEDWFLGSAGRRTGRWYGGLDDFSLITPAFETQLTHSAPSRYDVPLEGSFEEVMINRYFLEPDPEYQISRYDAYLQSFTPLRRLQNSAGSGRVLVVQDSFGQPVTAFMALSCAEVTVLDFRYYTEASLLEFLKNEAPYDAVVCINQLGREYFVGA